MFTTTPMLIGKELPPTPPNITNVKQSHSKWREGSALASISRHRKKRAPVGTTFSFTLNVASSVSLAFKQQRPGRRVGGSCVATSRKNRGKPKCTRTVTPGTLRFGGHAGVNRVAFQGRLSAKTKLKPGPYTLVITATSSAGQRSAAATLKFTIAR